MDQWILENRTDEGVALRAEFCPSKGMNLLSYRFGDIELIDQSTKEEFEKRYAGLGALSGPHFLRRKKELILPLKEAATFPHLEYVKSKGETDLFSHGISRYAPWSAIREDQTIEAKLSGKDEWNGCLLSDLEGQNFTLKLTATLTKKGLSLKYFVVSDTDSVVGIHYYFRLPKGKRRIKSDIQDTYFENGLLKKVPSEWFIAPHIYETHLNEPKDFTFHPFFNPCKGEILLETEEYCLHTSYRAPSTENCWQLYHPKEGSFVCIEPLSAKNPHKPHLTVSSVEIDLHVSPGVKNVSF